MLTRDRAPGTVRVLTGWAPGDAAPMVIAAVQRIGTRATAPTDNWAGGGISARVDLATGRLGAGVKRPAAKGAPPTRHALHPDSGAEIEGAILPRWEEVQAAALRALTAIPLVRYAGWDVIVPETGEPIMLEGNGNSSLDLIQVHGGLLREPHARRFYQALHMA